MLDQHFLLDQEVQIRQRELAEANEALQAEKKAWEMPRSEQAQYVHLDDCFKAIIRARRVAPQLRRRARTAPTSLRNRRGKRLMWLRKAIRLENEAERAAAKLGVSTDASREALVEAAKARLAEWRAELQARHDRIQTLKHRVWHAKKHLQKSVQELLSEGDGLTPRGVADVMGLPYWAIP